jgi:beta-mannosidase
MIEQSLNGEWQLRERDADEWLPGHVPGGVHLDLLAAGQISDPFLGDEELRVQWVAQRDWEYRREFVVDEAAAGQERQTLVFDGLDTLADVRLNDVPVGSADNMFRTWRWDVTGRLRPGSNTLSVTFRSAVRYGAEMEAVRHLDSVAEQLPGAPYLRKSPCHFGWDWGPKLPNVGFWQGVRLEGWSVARLADVRLSQRIGDGRARISAAVRAEFTTGAGARSIEARLHVVHPDGRVDDARAALGPDSPDALLSIDIAEPELWWPNSLGGQPLYRVEVELIDGSRTLDARSFQLGLRTLELRRGPDQWGESFTFVVNSVPVFAKGSNWIPADAFPGRVTPARLEALLTAAAAANHNMIRVWGGGYYEIEAFYDLCDRLGILIWQDFMFSCSVYPLGDDSFLANVRAEVSEQVRRLRHRACLALWCGNNEMERGWTAWGWDRPETQDLKAAYLRFFGETLPGWIADEASATPYWPSSPSSGRPLVEAIGERSGDEHEWIVWHGLAPFSAYGRESYRFISEFGFESLPAEATIAAFAPDPADWNLGSAVLDHHQRCEAGNARILFYLAQQFRLPRDFGGLVYLTQVLQAEAVRVGVEHWRRERDRCGGALYWQLNDCWPVSSWSSIDYFGRWKALHYATRRFFAPVLLSCAIESGDAVLAVTNDLVAAWRGEIRWSLERLDGQVLAAGSEEVQARGLGTTRVAAVPVPAEVDERRTTVLVAELLQDGSRCALVVMPFVPDKHLALRRPTIHKTVAAAGVAESSSRAATVVLRSDVLARWVELSLHGADAVFDDNYLDLPAGREVTIGFELPAGWNLERARVALDVRSVADTVSSRSTHGDPKVGGRGDAASR